MPDDFLRYDDMIQTALRGVMVQAIESVVKKGLPGEHHFLIIFRTDHPGVEISQALRRRFPDEMTIVLQHQYWDLKSDSTGFQVDLSFSNVMEHIRIPFAAVKTFTDPSVKFGLQFNVEDNVAAPQEKDAEVHMLKDEVESDDRKDPKPQKKVTEESKNKEEETGDVINLDAFRKK